MFQVRGDLWSLPPFGAWHPCLSRATWNRLSRAASYQVLISQKKNGDSTTFLGNLFQCLTVCNFFLLRWNGISYLLSCPWETLRRVLSIFFTLSTTYLFSVIRCTLSLLFSRKNSLSSLSLLYLSLRSLSDLSGLLLFLLPYIPVILVLGSPVLMHWFQFSRYVLLMLKKRGKIISLNPMAEFLLMWPRILLAFFLAMVHQWLVGNLFSTRAFSTNLFSKCSSPGR